MNDHATHSPTDSTDDPDATAPTDGSDPSEGSDPTAATDETNPTDADDSSSADHVLQIDDLSAAELAELFSTAAELKVAHRAGKDHAVLPNHSLAMLFEKPSTRTRVSFETGMTQLGGHAVYLGPDTTHLDHGEPVADTARALSRYVDAVMARVFDHDALVEMAEYATVPVVNGLSDAAHPCQTLADLFTVYEEFGGFEDVSVAWVGDGNNVGQSFAVGAAMAGLDLTMATPEGYGPDESVLSRAESHGSAPEVVRNPEEAVEGADVVYTDVWVSMGEEDERDEKLGDFEGFQVNDDLLAAAPEAAVMHCLPAHRGEEITGAVLESDRSVVWEQAENRMHTQKALLVHLLGDD
ncbi:ornithine carbamoyltransferase [Halorussus gelatinilyticus]|uniref:Ornithine carbamoyltransferase n=1 Tax=Halorussus gelatinilyticus TaxID=2937524 RepID=A0A8U0IKK5_9EURY|nr:ornithine carbamoyltransferase [Halorussus gelatinilyticus]UPW01677.1 ornithine carbamoyltransferase [Halorussus gelatinilyticus]